MTREKAFMSLSVHPIYMAAFRRLNHADLSTCFAFISTHGADSINAFNAAVTRMFLDQPNKPGNSGAIQDLLMAANTIAKRRGRPEKSEGAMVRLDVRVPRKLYSSLEAEAAQENLDLSTYVRKTLLERKQKGEVV